MFKTGITKTGHRGLAENGRMRSRDTELKMTEEESMRIEDLSSVTTGMKKITTIQHERDGWSGNVAEEVEYLDTVGLGGCARIEWHKLPVADSMVVHSPSDVVAVCYCGTPVHKDKIAICAECSAALCSRHRHRTLYGEYVCKRHLLISVIREILGI